MDEVTHPFIVIHMQMNLYPFLYAYYIKAVGINVLYLETRRVYLFVFWFDQRRLHP